jgi:hypothetical protein
MKAIDQRTRNLVELSGCVWTRVGASEEAADAA